jgi:hypothetical protein
MPAIEVYDGVLARVVRKRQPGLPVFIISGKYGLISSEELIEAYDVQLEEVLNREFVIERVVKPWLKITNGKPDKFETVWHITRGSYYRAIRILEKWTALQHVLPDDMPMRHNIGVMLRELKAFCVARPPYSDIDLDHIVTMYERAKAEGKVP